MSESAARSQVRYSEKTDPSVNPPLMTAEDVKLFYGITDTTLDIPLELAVAIVSSVIRGYTGRTLTHGVYTERFTYVAEPKIERYLIETPVALLTSPDNVILDNRNTGRVILVAGPVTEVTYEGGYHVMPPDLGAVFLELVRQQMAFMGHESLGTARSADAPKEKAVWLGSLKVEYAISATTVAAQATGMGSISEQALTPYAAILDKYISHRRLVAT